jgi:hypothetical protein
MTMELEFQISKDEDGFVWRQCPACESKFKWHDGPLSDVEDDVSVTAYYCPLCGASAEPSSWLTYEQIEAAENALTVRTQQMLGDVFNNTKKPKRNSFIQVDWKLDLPEVGVAQLEAHDDDFDIVASPCHPLEPVKVSVKDRTEFHCLICGDQFRV